MHTQDGSRGHDTILPSGTAAVAFRGTAVTPCHAIFSSAALLKRVHLPSQLDVPMVREIHAGPLFDFRKPGDLS